MVERAKSSSAKSATKISAGGNYFIGEKKKLKFIPTGSKQLDKALGGGWVQGRVTNIVGDKSTGKTLLAIEACANFAIKYPKGKIFYREVESAFDVDYAGALGFPVDRVDFGKDQINTVEEMYDDLVSICKRIKVPVLYIVDSLDSLSDEAEMAREIRDGSYGMGKAKKMSEMFRKIIRTLNRSDVTVIIISQIRDNIVVGSHKKYTRAGGHALDFYASHVVFLQHLKAIKKTRSGQERTTGILIRAKVEKNKVSLPFREAQFPILFGFGIDDAESCLQYLDQTGGLKKIGLSKEKLKDYRKELAAMNDNDYRAELSDLRDAVSRRWDEIETDFIPQRRKYA